MSSGQLEEYGILDPLLRAMLDDVKEVQCERPHAVFYPGKSKITNGFLERVNLFLAGPELPFLDDSAPLSLEDAATILARYCEAMDAWKAGCQ